jgi:hypothetical protein
MIQAMETQELGPPGKNGENFTTHQTLGGGDWLQ